MENSNDFTKKMIGDLDTANFKRIHELYESLINLLNPFRWEYEGVRNIGSAPITDILQVLNMNQANMEIFLKRSYIEANGLTFPGLNVDKIIEQNLLELPEEYNTLLVAKKEIESIIEKILSTSFVFPFSQLFSEDDNVFILTEEFETNLNESLKTYTENEVQNSVLAAVEKFCDAANSLIELKIIRPEGNLWTYVGSDLALAVENKKGSARPLIPSRMMFNRSPLKRFSEKKGSIYPDRRRTSLVR